MSAQGVSTQSRTTQSRTTQSRPWVVCLIGRTAHREAYRAANAQETLAGKIVLSCGVFRGDPEWGEGEKGMLDELHRAKIRVADEVLLIEPDDVGDSTRAEIAYAHSLGKPIYTFRLTRAAGVGDAYQREVAAWIAACFGPEVAADRLERAYRFLEEALELAQAAGVGADDVAALCEYVFARPVGELAQEVGGVLVTLSGLCTAFDVDMDASGRAELERVWAKVELIRAKHAAKLLRTPLPGQVPA